MKHYNTWRPHEALENQTPGGVYHPKRNAILKPQAMNQAA
jgi:transposase InsO family protein